jgi:hypothetical protein
LIALSIFVKYTDERDILSIAPTGSVGRKTSVYVITGMYFEAKDRYNGIAVNGQSEQLLEDAINRPYNMMEQGFYATVKFRYLPQNLLGRSIIVEAENRTTADVDMRSVRRLTEDTTYRLAHYLRGVGRELLPESIKMYVASNKMLARITEIDVLLLMVPLPKQGDQTKSIHKMAELMQILSEDGQTDVRLVVTDVDRVEGPDDDLDYQDTYDRDTILSEAQKATSDEETDEAIQYVRRHLIDQVYLVSGDIEPGGLRGFRILLQEL